MTSQNIMSLEGVGMQFGPFHALSELSFEIKAGEVLGVAGPNGAGKSTLLNVCTGGLCPTSGKVLFDGREITGLPRHARCAQGIAMTFQIPTVISSLTVAENLLVGRSFGGSHQHDFDQIVEITGLGPVLDAEAGTVDLLARKTIMLGAALATGPRIVFMDEPLGGLNAEEIQDFVQIIDRARQAFGVTIVMVEHKIRALAEIADRILIINFGKFVCLDRPSVVLNDDHVVEIYLGKKHDA
ncbi:ABC transporter ATP-binding protein [Celeribacter neptunius]|uniref:Branched-chain amino acid transport system ATP-binding protein n=1 Tax=Celeribacter neptunius TaxID=588602 RepID=A0A1I3UD04_9RHOB|nr:ATP-binding cassette domain-containing protein [Celeribacter neptunius]SFJ80792.1 branched-chain amino acid transport system ATP-binding protein [Celeribacter neptunius]